MKNVLEWVKDQWIIVVCSVIALAALPSLWSVSAGWNNTIVEGVQERAQSEYRKVSNPNVNLYVYDLQGQRQLERSEAPYRGLIERYSELWAEVEAEMGKVTERANEFNKGAEREVLVSGVLPEPAFGYGQTKPREFASIYINRAHRRLLDLMNAGTPPDPAALAQDLQNELTSRVQRFEVSSGTQMSPAEMEELRNELFARRIATYRDRSTGISVYASEDVFVNVPEVVPEDDIPLAQVWDWQQQYWICQDICRAIALANRVKENQLDIGVPGSVVKRVLEVQPEPSRIGSGNRAPRGGDPFGGDTSGAGPDYTTSLTGRLGGASEYYDVRAVRCSLIVASARIPELFNAISMTNFMTVLDMDISEFDVREHLRQGYFYGNDALVRLDLRIETVWLRDWTGQDMPEQVKLALGMRSGEGDASDPGAPQAPSRGGGRGSPGRFD